MDEPTTSPLWLRRAGLVVGPASAVLLTAALPSSTPAAARMTASLGALMVVWWLTAAIPLEATALLPIALLPLLGVGGVREAAAPYANEVIFLFMGGMMMGVAIERWGLHRRIAALVLRLAGSSPAGLVGAAMLATASIDFWISNTATAVMMLPIGLSIVGAVGDRAGPRFAPCMLLAIAYSGSISGVGTLVGTPPNAVLAGFAANHPDIPPVTFLSWLKVGMPMVAVFLPVAWILLTRVLFRVPFRPVPGLREALRHGEPLGFPSRGEVLTLIIFASCALAWLFRVSLCEATGLMRTNAEGRPEYLLSDAGIGVIGAILMFIVPVRRGEPVLDWRSASRIPWGVLLMFGGGLSLAGAMTDTGLDKQIGGVFDGVAGLPDIVVILLITATIVFLSEIASNTAIATSFIPIAYAAAERLDIPPPMLLFPTVAAASWAFMMPMGTPPNALVFGTGRVTLGQMVRAGFVLNLIGIIVIVGVCRITVPWFMATGDPNRGAPRWGTPAP